MELIVEAAEDGSLTLPASLLNTVPKTRYVVEVQADAILVRPDKSTVR